MRFLILQSRSIALCFALLSTATASAQFGGGGSPKQWQLWKINVDGTGLAQLVDTPGYNCNEPAWSPDGKTIACNFWPIKTWFCLGQVALIPADGSQPPQSIGQGVLPSWSPDGKLIACQTYGADNDKAHILVMNADGTGREKIIAQSGAPHWSPQGNQILFNDDGAISLFDLSMGQKRLVFSGPYPARQAFSISPDGSRYCLTDHSGQLVLATTEESSHRILTKILAKGQCSNPSWSPDGKRVVFSWRNYKSNRLWIKEVDSNAFPVLIPGQDPDRNNDCPDWSPDGKTIVFASDFVLPKQDEIAQAASITKDSK